MTTKSFDSQANLEKSKAALSSVLWSGLLTVLKIVAALSSNSLGLLSEALHSALDLVAAAITFLAVKISAIPADKCHPFGHGKVENLSALAETLLLFITCGWILMEAVERLFFHTDPVEPSWWVFGVVLISLIVDVNRSAMLRRVAKEHRSQALEADALHFTTDIWSSAVVLVGLLCVLAARLFEPGTTPHTLLNKADAVAALGVAAIVVKVSWNLARRSVHSLMDGGLEEESEKVRSALAANAPGYTCRQVRVRESGTGYFVDLIMEAPPGNRVDVAHDISDMLETAVEEILPGAETTIHVEPAQEGEHSGRFGLCHRLAAAHSLEIHNLVLTTLHDGLRIFVHIEMDPHLDLEQAHNRVSAYERELIRRVGAVHVISHIEPKIPRTAPEDAQELTRQHSRIIEVLHQTMANYPSLCHCHDETILVTDGHLSLAFRCCLTTPGTVSSAHQQASLLEADLRLQLPHLGRITIHVEPAGGAAPSTPARG